MVRNVVFFHNDLDGIMSALFLSIALNKEMIYIPAKHGINIQKLIERYSESNYNIYIVDYTPNKLATLSIDHHPSNLEYFNSLDKSKYLFNPSAPSCAGLIVRNFGLAEYKEIAALVDMVDSFDYKSVNEAAATHYDFIFSELILKDENVDYCMKRALKILKTFKSEEYFKRSCEIIFGKKAIESEILKIQKINAETYKVLDDIVYKNFVFLKSNEHQTLNGNLAYKKGYDGVFTEQKIEDKEVYHHALVVNKFKEEKFKNVDVSAICKKFPGGGGHRMAAGFSTSEPVSLEQFKDIIDQVLEQIS
jgi:nanoRNase/pAp phosphatase (c-di-AMP/oligoRNAs hydrolase)